MEQLLAGWPPAEQALGAHRWGLPITTPRMLAGLLRNPTAAGRVCRRGADAGAPQLVRLLIEHGGNPVPRQSALEFEAARLRGWFPMTETEKGWSVPMEFALAAFRVWERERFFVATLLPRLSRPDTDGLLRELDIPKLSTHAHRVRMAAEKIAASEPGPNDQGAVESVEELQSIRSRDISQLHCIPGSGGRRFNVQFSDGEVVEITPRELAEKAGATFTPVSVAGPTQLFMERTMPEVHVPTVQPIGAIITFSTSRAADEAFGMPEFQSVMVRRLGDRRAATRPSCGALAARELLRNLGFHVDAEVA